MSPYPPFRLTRATAFGLVCVSLTLLSHAIAAGTWVPPVVVVVAGLLVTGVAWVVAGHERAPATILGGLLGGQFGLHVLFAAAQPPADHVPHAYGADQFAAGQPGFTMTLAHVAAAAVCAAWMCRGERLAWSLARRLAALAALSFMGVLALFTLLPLAGPQRVRPRDTAEARPRIRVLRHCLVLRGPPARSPAFGESSL